MANGRQRMGRKGSNKAKGGMLGKDEGKHQKPGFLGRTKCKTVQGRVGYTQNEKRTGVDYGKSTKISL